MPTHNASKNALKEELRSLIAEIAEIDAIPDDALTPEESARLKAVA